MSKNRTENNRHNGPNGANEPNGTNGTNGANEANGTNGTNGTNGLNGTNEPNEPNEPNGANGTNEPNGANGANGANEPNGTNGANETNGTNGTNGANGANEPNGTNGTNGTNEPNGTNGANELNGTNGANGTNGTHETHETYETHEPHETHEAYSLHEPPAEYGQGGKGQSDALRFLPRKGKYRSLLAYQKAECIYDITFYFAHKYLEARRDRTVDQVIQAARSGKQNIVEGSAASSTSSETELKLLGVARASMQETLADYEDYLRTRHLKLWGLNDPRTRQTQAFSRSHNRPEDYTKDIDKRSAEAICNIAITLIHQYDSLMGGLMDKIQKDFTEHGGIKERMTAARIGYRNEQKKTVEHLSRENEVLRNQFSQLQAEFSKLQTELAQLKSQNHQQ